MLDYAKLRAEHMNDEVPCAWLESSEPSYILYTSGTTGKPKGVQRDTGGYAVALAASMKLIFCGNAGRDLLRDQRHRLGGGPQLHHLRSTAGRHGDHHVRRHADPARRRCLVEHRREVQGHDDVLGADRDPGAEEAGSGAPEEIRPVVAAAAVPRGRAARRADRALDRRRHRQADHRQLLADRDRLADPGDPARRRGAAVEVRLARRALPTATTVKLYNEATGEEITAHHEKGVVAIDGPLPPGCMTTVWGDDARFVKTYWTTIPNRQVYSTFDWGIRDEDGYFFILGRTDDVINVAGHRLGTREIEESLSSHPNIAEVAVVGVADQLKGQVAMAFAILKDPSLADTPEKKLAHEGEMMKTVDSQLGRSRAAGARALRQRAAEDTLRQAAAALDPGAVRRPRSGRPDDDRGSDRAGADPRRCARVVAGRQSTAAGSRKLAAVFF